MRFLSLCCARSPFFVVIIMHAMLRCINSSSLPFRPLSHTLLSFFVFFSCIFIPLCILYAWTTTTEIKISHLASGTLCYSAGIIQIHTLTMKSHTPRALCQPPFKSSSLVCCCHSHSHGPSSLSSCDFRIHHTTQQPGSIANAYGKCPRIHKHDARKKKCEERDKNHLSEQREQENCIVKWWMQRAAAAANGNRDEEGKKYYEGLIYSHSQEI